MLRIDREAEAPQQLQSLQVRLDLDAFAMARRHRRTAADGARARLAGVEQLERAGGEVARVGAGLEPLGRAFAIELGQVFAGHVDFAARLEQRGELLGQLEPAAAPRIVLRLCVTSSPCSPSPRVAPTVKTPFSYEQGDGHAVDLQLDHVDDRLAAEQLANALVEFAQSRRRV